MSEDIKGDEIYRVLYGALSKEKYSVNQIRAILASEIDDCYRRVLSVAMERYINESKVSEGDLVLKALSARRMLLGLNLDRNPVVSLSEDSGSGSVLGSLSDEELLKILRSGGGDSGEQSG